MTSKTTNQLELSDPVEAASRVATFYEGDSSGTVNDRLADSMSDMFSATSLLMHMHITLDHIADDRGLFPDDVHGELRETQRTVQELADWAEAYRDALAEEADSLRAPQDT